MPPSRPTGHYASQEQRRTGSGGPVDNTSSKTMVPTLRSDVTSYLTWPLMAHFRTYEITIKHQAYRPLEVGSCLIDQLYFTGNIFLVLTQ